MSIRILRFFWPGNGKYLLGLALVVGGLYFVGNAVQRDAARAPTASAKRPLGKADSGPAVDLAHAPHEETLSNRPLRPLPSDYAPPAPPPRPRTETPVLQKAALFVYEAPAATPAPSVAPAKETSKRSAEPRVWLPMGTPIRCLMTGSAESSNGLDAPIIGLVMEDVRQNCDGIQRLVIPRGTLVKSWANPGAIRDRLRVSGNWVLTFWDGRSLKVEGTALAHQTDVSGKYVGLENKTGGMIGHVIETDPAARLEALIPLFITSVLSGVNTAAGAVLQASHSSGMYQAPDTTPVVEKYMDQLMEGKPDTRYVRVDAGTQFWLTASETIDPATRSVFGESKGEEAAEQSPKASALDPAVQSALEVQKALYPAQTQPETPSTTNEAQAHLKY